MNKGRDVLELHHDMLQAQKAGGDFDLSFRELMQVWKLSSTSAVDYQLQRLLKCGLVKCKDHGRYKNYRAVTTETARRTS